MDDTLDKKEEDNKEPVENQAADKPEEPEEDVVEKNWRAVREKQKEKERLQKEQAEQLAKQQEMIAALEAALKTGTVPQQQQQPVQQGTGFDVHDQEWITGAQFKQYMTELEKKQEEERKRYEAEKKQNETVQQMQARYPDYREVLSKENLAYLEYHEPEVAAGIQQIADPYYQMSMAYKSVKKFVPPISPEDKQKIERTQSMPRSPSQAGLGITPQGTDYRSGKLSRDQKEEIYQQMLRDAR